MSGAPRQSDPLCMSEVESSPAGIIPRRKHRPSARRSGSRAALTLAKDVANAAKAAVGVSFPKLADAMDVAVTLAALRLDRRDTRYHIRYGDLLAMSVRTHTKAFVEHLLEPINKNLRGEP